MRLLKSPVLVSALMALMIPLSGCVAAPTLGKTTSTPTQESVGETLKPFYTQTLQWSTCHETFQCATAKAPLDWANPAKKSIDLALIRSSTSGTRLGSLLVNPGGPGGSGYDFVQNNLDYAVSTKLREHYDIVGFDPRGVNKSSAVKCYAPKEMDKYLFALPTQPEDSDAYIAELAASSGAFGQACAAGTGELLGFVDTVSAARDLDLLRATLGDTKLNYLGFSYGTFLGATYAGLYPQNTGRLVLDGAIDPAVSDFEVTKTQAVGFESALRAFLTDCATQKACPFPGTVDDSMAGVARLLGELDKSPLRATDGRQLGRATMFTAIVYPLYSKDNWPYLTKLFTSVLAGKADTAFTLADAYYSRSEKGVYGDNSTEAFLAINCLDYTVNASIPVMRAQAVELAKAAPVFGPAMDYGQTGCVNWPYKTTRERLPIAASGSGPIIVVGTTNDPATPYVWAQSLAKQLRNGHLVTFKGEGHTAYNKSNSCVNSAVDDYFISGTVPTVDPMC